MRENNIIQNEIAIKINFRTISLDLSKFDFFSMNAME